MRMFDMRNDTDRFIKEAMLLGDMLALTMGADDFREDADMNAREPSLFELATHERAMMRFARLMQQADDLRDHVAKLRQVRLLIWMDKHVAEAGSARYKANEDRLTKLILAAW
ncbi:MAG: hypothetical protein EON60_12840 [Alphaproteobacteria bacterium]|nr:MAG: hypothetical protein EON60_12840 [Alphaproteobacteria bacterium]